MRTADVAPRRKCDGEVDSLVSRTFARAQTPSRRAWLTAARRAVPGDRPTPSPRPVLTATPDFVSRHRSARRGRAPLRALFCPVRGLPPPVAVSSTARHALPDPSYHPVRAADSQHTLECMARPAEQRSRPAVCRGYSTAAPVLLTGPQHLSLRS